GPHSVTFSPSSPGTVIEGGNLTVRCSADCNPPCGYSWTLGTQQLSSSSLLTLADINRNQKGEYTCTVNNTFIPKSRSGRFSLTVFYSPRIQIKMLIPNPHKEGDDLDLTCTADSNPRSPQKFKWIYGRYVMNEQSLLSHYKSSNNRDQIYSGFLQKQSLNHTTPVVGKHLPIPTSVKPQKFNRRSPTSGIQPWESILGNPSLGIQPQESNLGNPTAGVQPRESNLGNPTSII
ncbi:carcinoembryonic antigen-related cell adhesion molecule 5-like, partial [Gigantopelta aegis]|uniref:carcinoembryonic antigen-related cell adhesion molecule 5-like n=1 Tax=Gigantopelta aegis TaxID=1735272 RepID=UPI001B88BB76